MAWKRIKCVRSSIVEKGEKKSCTISREKETIIFMHAAKLYFLSHWDTRKLKINLGLEAFWCVSQTIFFCVRMRALCIVVLSLSDVLFSYSLWTPSFDSVFFPIVYEKLSYSIIIEKKLFMLSIHVVTSKLLL